MDRFGEKIRFLIIIVMLVAIILMIDKNTGFLYEF